MLLSLSIGPGEQQIFLLYKSLFKAWGLNPGYLGYLIEGGLKRTRANISNIYYVYFVDVSSWVYLTNCLWNDFLCILLLKLIKAHNEISCIFRSFIKKLTIEKYDVYAEFLLVCCCLSSNPLCNCNFARSYTARTPIYALSLCSTHTHSHKYLSFSSLCTCWHTRTHTH